MRLKKTCRFLTRQGRLHGYMKSTHDMAHVLGVRRVLIVIELSSTAQKSKTKRLMGDTKKQAINKIMRRERVSKIAYINVSWTCWSSLLHHTSQCLFPKYCLALYMGSCFCLNSKMVRACLMTETKYQELIAFRHKPDFEKTAKLATQNRHGS